MGEGSNIAQPKDAANASNAQDVEGRKEREKDLQNVLRGRTCFVVMPYGNKPIPKGKISAPGSVTFENFDFNAVYSELIKPCLTAEGFKVIRSDEESGAGMIHQQMIQRIIDSDLVIADVSSLTANVELS